VRLYTLSRELLINQPGLSSLHPITNLLYFAGKYSVGVSSLKGGVSVGSFKVNIGVFTDLQHSLYIADASPSVEECSDIYGLVALFIRTGPLRGLMSLLARGVNRPHGSGGTNIFLVMSLPVRCHKSCLLLSPFIGLISARLFLYTRV